MNQQEIAIYQRGKEAARAEVFDEIFWRSDKRGVIKALFAKTANKAVSLLANGDADKGRQMVAYSEGFRHAYNVLTSLGDGLEAYRNIINPSISIELTEEDIKKYR